MSYFKIPNLPRVSPQIFFFAHLLVAAGTGSARGAEVQESARSADDVRAIAETHGFTSVRCLKPTDDGSWVGQATRHDELRQFEVDQRGNFITSPLAASENCRAQTDRQRPKIRLFLVLR